MERLVNSIREEFKDIEFIEKGHRYLVNGEPLRGSVSGFIRAYREEQDWDKILTRTASRRGVDKEVLAKEWDDRAKQGRENGTKIHNFAEEYVLNGIAVPESIQEEAVVKFWKDLPEHIQPALVEEIMYHKECMIGGTADIVLYDNRTGKFIIADYKTDKNLFKNFRDQRLLAPFQNLRDQGHSMYSLQLSTYQVFLEQVQGVEVSHRALIHLLPEGGYATHFVGDYSEAMREEMYKRYKQ